MTQDNYSNRQVEVSKKRGRPTKEAESQAPFAPVEEVGLPPVLGMKCPHCGRAMMPKVINAARLLRTLDCSICGKRMRAIYSDDGRPALVRPI